MKAFFKKKKNTLIKTIKYLDTKEIFCLLKVNKLFYKTSLEILNNNLDNIELNYFELVYLFKNEIIKNNFLLTFLDIKNLLYDNASKLTDYIYKNSNYSSHNTIDNNNNYKKIYIINNYKEKNICLSKLLDNNNYDILGYVFKFFLDSQNIEFNTYNILCNSNYNIEEKLFSLNLSEFNIGEKGFLILSSILKYCKYLNFLDLNDNKVTSECLKNLFDSIVNNFNIKKFKIDLSNCEINNINLKEILFSLNIMNKNLKKFFYRNLDLTINLLFNSFSNEVLEQVVEFTSELNYNNYIYNSSNKVHFVLSNNQLSSDCLKYIFKNRKTIRSLDSLNLSHNKINNFDYLKEYIIGAKTSKKIQLKSLDFSYNKIDDIGCFHLSSAISKGIYASEINLFSNKITKEGLEYIINSLEKNENRRKIKEDSNSLNNIKKLMSYNSSENNNNNSFQNKSNSNRKNSLNSNNSNDNEYNYFYNNISLKIKNLDFDKLFVLKELNLGNNDIQDAGSDIISNLIKTNYPIESLDLSECNLSYPEKLFISLNFNKHIKKLCLNFNKNIFKNLNKLEKLYNINNSLESLQLDYCNLNENNSYSLISFIKKGIKNLNVNHNDLNDYFLDLLSSNLLNLFIDYIDFSSNKSMYYYKLNRFLSKENASSYIKSIKFKIFDINLNNAFNDIIYYNHLESIDLSYSNIKECNAIELLKLVLLSNSINFLNLTDCKLQDSFVVNTANILFNNNNNANNAKYKFKLKCFKISSNYLKYTSYMVLKSIFNYQKRTEYIMDLDNRSFNDKLFIVDMSRSKSYKIDNVNLMYKKLDDFTYIIQ